MKNICTSSCKQFGHPEFRIEFDAKAILESDVSRFANLLTDMVRDGSRFENDQSFQIGWSITKLVSDGDGFLSFREPDFKSMPIIWQRGLTKSLRHMRLHKDVVESVLPNESLAIPSLGDSCIICTNLNDTTHVIMDRNEQQGNISGWFLGCRDKKHDHNAAQSLHVISLYEAVVSHAPVALGYLGLPAATVVLLGSGTPSFSSNGHGLKIQNGSYLEAVFGKRGAHRL
ncbi:MAG: hypothetical protein P4L53_04835 [Candidatus Obscuribacterales bacterium]|nr:hypothetical protein [Candidatus Obscuribacterales bacterium]